MARYIVARVIGILGVSLAVSILTFLLMHAVPGGPFDASLSQDIPLPPAFRQALMQKYSLDKPLYEQYVSYITHALRGDFGVSFRYGEPVATFLRRNWPTTLQLGLTTLCVALGAGLSLGILSALHANSWIDRAASLVVVSGIIAPSFVVAVLLMVVFSVRLHWLPTGGWGTARQMVLPVITYALGPLAVIARFTRASMIESLPADHIRTAHAKGLPPHLVLTCHALRNALIPLLTVLGPVAVHMVVGSFFVETIFRIPGIGSQLTTAIYNRDYPLIMALTLLWSAVVALTYLATDLLYVIVDPRIRLAEAQR